MGFGKVLPGGRVLYLNATWALKPKAPCPESLWINTSLWTNLFDSLWKKTELKSSLVKIWRYGKDLPLIENSGKSLEQNRYIHRQIVSHIWSKRVACSFLNRPVYWAFKPKHVQVI